MYPLAGRNVHRIPRMETAQFGRNDVEVGDDVICRQRIAQMGTDVFGELSVLASEEQ